MAPPRESGEPRSLLREDAIAATVVSPATQMRILAVDLGKRHPARMRMIWKSLRALALLSALAGAAACQTLSEVDKGLYGAAEAMTETDRVTGARSLSFRDREAQIDASAKRVGALVQKLEGGDAPYNAALDQEAYQRVSRITRRILRASHLADEADRWRVYLLPNDEVNAFVTGGAEVMVNLGLVRAVDSDHELAAVIGHEVAHVAANHVGEAQATLRTLALAGSGSVEREGYVEAFKQGSEQEADKLGMLYMALAGYNPMGAVRFWDDRVRDDPGYRYFRVHPTANERMRAARETVDAVKQYRRPGRINPKAREILSCNELWCPEEDKVAPGEGGGLLAILETALTTAGKHYAARAERKRQELEILRGETEALRQAAESGLYVYDGAIQSGGGSAPAQTAFRMTQQGPVEGRYRWIEDGRTYEGSLSYSHRNDADKPVYRWRDSFGEGMAVFSFQNDGASFEAHWYNPDGSYGGAWKGSL